MSELRKDPIVGRWVIIAPERMARPLNLSEPELDPHAPDPFLEGREEITTPEIYAARNPGSRPNGPGWKVRVISNKFPALGVDGDLENRGEGMYDMMHGIGAHEVIVECPHGEANLSQLPLENVREVLHAYQARLNDLKRDTRLVHALVFKNKGARAGASLSHAHSQLIVTPIVPITIQEELDGAAEYFRFRGRCIFSDMIEQERTTRKRVVLETSQFIVFCPFASRFPFETWIVPKTHRSHFEKVPRGEIEELGEVLKRTLRKLERGLNDPPYNYIIHSAPFNTPDLPHYRWHIEIFPRMSGVAGFEWGSGFYINAVPPEEAAEFLRETRDD
ncbi:MAG: galactose-1-phosphate uridylyltransferase [Planctomycetota bacterium]|nr:MAG: galactose-1-phosphate uridylyltransferase [Planctomycetota bacterium]